MNTQPLIGPGALLASSWAFFSKHWKKLVSIIAVPVIVFVLLELLMAGLVTFGAKQPVLVTLSLIFGFIFFVLFLIVTVSAYPALIGAIHRLSTEENASITVLGQYKFGLKLFGSTLLLMLIGGLSMYGSIALLVIPGIIFAVYVAFHFFAMVVDGKKGFSAFISSYELVKGRWWATFGRIVLVGAILFGAILVVEVLMMVAGSLGGLFVIVGILLLFVVEIIGVLFIMIYLYQLYLNLKATRGDAITPNKTIKVLMVILMVLGIVVVIAYVSLMFMRLAQLGDQYKRMKTGLDDTSLFLQGNVYENTQYGFKLTYPASSTFAYNHPETGFIVRFFLPDGQTVKGDDENIAIYVEKNVDDLDQFIADSQKEYAKYGPIDIKEVMFGGQKAYREIVTTDYTSLKETKELFYYTVKDGTLYGLNYFPVIEQNLPLVDEVAASFQFTK